MAGFLGNLEPTVTLTFLRLTLLTTVSLISLFAPIDFGGSPSPIHGRDPRLTWAPVKLA